MHPMQQKLIDLSKVRDLSKLSYREIGRQLAKDGDLNTRVHPQTVRYHIEQLISAELLQESDRPILKLYQVKNSVTNSVMNLIKIPIVGSANCGPATIFADESIQGYLEISPILLKTKNYQDLFALKAQGDSMNRATVVGKNIDNGDFVVVDRSKKTPRDGEYVVVVRDSLANIKKIYFNHKEEMIMLRSESTQDYSPIYVSPQDEWDGLISGTVVQVIKDRASTLT
jgi:repressor LexA